MVGPVALVIPLIAWMVLRSRSRGSRGSVELPPPETRP
jgi:hypothetical protein